MDPKYKYLVGFVFDDGRVRPLGWSKDKEYATAIAKRHKVKLFKLKEIKNG